MADLGRMSQLMNVLTGVRRMKEKEDPLERAQTLLNLENTALDIKGKRRTLAGPSPTEKYQEEQRSQQVGSALAMFSDLYKTASPSSKKILGEQMGSLWGVMASGDKTKFKMLVSHTPLNPNVQKGMWFEETNPRPQMPIIKEGDGSWTNNPPRSPEYRKLWAEYDIASDEWSTLRKMAISGEKPEKKGWKNVPKFYDSEESNVKYYRDPIDRRIKEFDFKNVDQAKMATAIEKGWATTSDIMKNGSLPISAPREYVVSGNPVTVTQRENLVNGGTQLEYNYAGPPKEEDILPPSDLIDAIHLVDSGIMPSELKVKSPATISYFTQIQDVIASTGGERQYKLRALQESIVEKYPSPKRFIPFIPPPARQKDVWYRIQQAADWIPGLAYLIPTPSPGKQGNVVLVPADRRVAFYDNKGEERRLWWSDVYKMAYDNNGSPVRETLGKVEGSQLDLSWSQ